MADKRIYLVTARHRGNNFPDTYLVRASHPSRAVAYVVAKLGISAEVADQDALIDALTAGLKVEDVG